MTCMLLKIKMTCLTFAVTANFRMSDGASLVAVEAVGADFLVDKINNSNLSNNENDNIIGLSTLFMNDVTQIHPRPHPSCT